MKLNHIKQPPIVSMEFTMDEIRALRHFFITAFLDAEAIHPTNMYVMVDDFLTKTGDWLDVPGNREGD